MKHGFLIDMDGVIYRGSDPIPGAVEFVSELKKRGIPFLFLTNNSQRTRLDIVARLARMGFNDVKEDDVFTSAIATAQFVARQKPHGTAYVIGEGGLLNALNQVGIAVVDHEPEFVIIGEGKAMTLEMIDTAVRMIHRGAKLIATNLDPNCPIQDGIRPGCGAFVSMLETATGKKAISLGKPSPVMFRAARKVLDLRTSETTIIGDTMETDILGGVNMGYRTILVLSGGTHTEDLSKFSFQPDLVVSSVAELLKMGMLDNISP